MTAHPKSVLIVLGMNSRHVGHTVTFPAHSGGGWTHQFFDGLLQGNIFEVQELWRPLVGLLAARIQATVAEMENADERIGDDEQKADSVVFNEQESIQRVVNRFCRQFHCVNSQQAKLQEVVKQCGLTDLLSRDARKRPVERIACFEASLGNIPELLEVVRWNASKFQHGRTIKARDKALQSISNGSNRSCEAEFRHAIREPVEELSSAILDASDSATSKRIVVTSCSRFLFRCCGNTLVLSSAVIRLAASRSSSRLFSISRWALRCSSSMLVLWFPVAAQSRTRRATGGWCWTKCTRIF